MEIKKFEKQYEICLLNWIQEDDYKQYIGQGLCEEYSENQSSLFVLLNAETAVGFIELSHKDFSNSTISNNVYIAKEYRKGFIPAQGMIAGVILTFKDKDIRKSYFYVYQFNSAMQVVMARLKLDREAEISLPNGILEIYAMYRHQYERFVKSKYVQRVMKQVTVSF